MIINDILNFELIFDFYINTKFKYLCFDWVLSEIDFYSCNECNYFIQLYNYWKYNFKQFFNISKTIV